MHVPVPHNPKFTRKNQPIIKFERSRFEFSFEILAAIGLLYGLYELMINYGSLPEQIPTHYNFSGRPDAWGSRFTLWLPVAIMAVVYALMSLLVRAPHHFNYPWKITAENAPRQYQLACLMITALKTIIVWLFTWIILTTIRLADGGEANLMPVGMYVFLGLIALVVGGYFILAYRAR